jgi:RNA polymerase subunit RPABC4/transcription elongation factor Spt4
VSLVDERRCPNCHALVSADAEWCGQCFTSLRPVRPEQAPPAVEAAAQASVPASVAGGVPSGAPDRGDRPAPTWTCPTCQHVNAIELDVCEVCGTAFAALFRQDEARPSVDPRTAFTRSLLFPGLGHRALGRGADGLARAVLFVWTFGTTLLILSAGLSSGPVAGLFSMYLLLSLTVYVLTAFEAYRMAQGDGPIVSSRVLLWGAVSLVLVSVLMATFIIFSAARS